MVQDGYGARAYDYNTDTWETLTSTNLGSQKALSYIGNIPGPPSKPTGLVATPGNSQVTLKW